MIFHQLHPLPILKKHPHNLLIEKNTHEAIAMVVTNSSMTLEDYLNYDNETDIRHELVDGVLVEMPPESTLNTQIAAFLLATFLQLGIPYTRLGLRHQIAVAGARATAREPDLMIHSEESAAAIEGQTQALLTHDMPPPMLVIEVVSPNQENRDYRYKRTEYAARHIPEYWIVDPIAGQMMVLQWVDGLYEACLYQGNEHIVSFVFPTLKLTAAKVLNAGR
jgi:Uma2 family endonuclease